MSISTHSFPHLHAFVNLKFYAVLTTQNVPNCLVTLLLFTIFILGIFCRCFPKWIREQNKNFVWVIMNENISVWTVWHQELTVNRLIWVSWVMYRLTGALFRAQWHGLKSLSKSLIQRKNIIPPVLLLSLFMFSNLDNHIFRSFQSVVRYYCDQQLQSVVRY